MRQAILSCDGTMTSYIKELVGESNLTHHEAARRMEEFPELVELFNSRKPEIIDRAIHVLMINLAQRGKRQLKTAMFILKNAKGSQFAQAESVSAEGDLTKAVTLLIGNALGRNIPQPIQVTHRDIVRARKEKDAGDPDDEDDDEDSGDD